MTLNFPEGVNPIDAGSARTIKFLEANGISVESNAGRAILLAAMSMLGQLFNDWPAIPGTTQIPKDATYTLRIALGIPEPTVEK